MSIYYIDGSEERFRGLRFFCIMSSMTRIKYLSSARKTLAAVYLGRYFSLNSPLGILWLYSSSYIMHNFQCFIDIRIANFIHPIR